jgi:four helix bundle protein
MNQNSDYQTWLKQVPGIIKHDALWDFEIYRKSLYLADLAWFDAEQLMQDSRGRGVAWQLINSAGSVAANIEEGFGRGFGKDYARFLRISLGSAREVRGWYYRGRHVWPPHLVKMRLALISEIISGLVITSNQQRRR